MLSIDLMPRSGGACSVAEVLGQYGRSQLNARGCVCVALGYRAVDHVDTILCLEEPDLVVRGFLIVGQIHRSPFNIENAIWGYAEDAREYAASAVWKRAAAGHIRGGYLVIPVGKYDLVSSC